MTAVHIRYRTDISVLDRVLWNGLELDITSVSNPDERRRYLQLDYDAQVPA